MLYKYITFENETLTNLLNEIEYYINHNLGRQDQYIKSLNIEYEYRPTINQYTFKATIFEQLDENEMDSLKK